MDKVYFAKTKLDAKIPSKKGEDAGFDLYACFEGHEIRIGPGEISIIPTGIAISFAEHMVMFIKERSSTGAIGLAVRMGVIDSGYRGEIIIGLNNTTKESIVISKEVRKIIKRNGETIYPYAKAIAQGVFLCLPKIISEEIDYNDLLSAKSERVINNMGKSGK